MTGILVFGGSTEGRKLAEALSKNAVKAHIFTATAYGGDLLADLPHIRVYSERLDAKKMHDFMVEHNIHKVVDATHPYAKEVTLNIKEATRQAKLSYIRVLREEEDCSKFPRVKNTAEAVCLLSETQGNILLTTGSKELELYAKIPDFKTRVYARVLPAPEVLEHCLRLGLKGEQIIAMQGPFSHELNLALIKHCQASFLVSKNTGQAGGMAEKISAVKEAGIELIVVDRPLQEKGVSVIEALALLGISPTGEEGGQK